MVRATVDAIENLRMPADVAALRGKSVNEVLGSRLAWSAETGHVGVSANQWAAGQGGALAEASAAEVQAAHKAHDAEVAGETGATATAVEEAPAEESGEPIAPEAFEPKPGDEPTKTPEDA
jgi:hypothetical protein